MGTRETDDDMITRTNENIPRSLLAEDTFYRDVHLFVFFYDWLDEKVDIV